MYVKLKMVKNIWDSWHISRYLTSNTDSHHTSMSASCLHSRWSASQCTFHSPLSTFWCFLWDWSCLSTHQQPPLFHDWNMKGLTKSSLPFEPIEWSWQNVFRVLQIPRSCCYGILQNHCRVDLQGCAQTLQSTWMELSQIVYLYLVHQWAWIRNQCESNDLPCQLSCSHCVYPWSTECSRQVSMQRESLQNCVQLVHTVSAFCYVTECPDFY